MFTLSFRQVVHYSPQLCLYPTGPNDTGRCSSAARSNTNEKMKSLNEKRNEKTSNLLCTSCESLATLSTELADRTAFWQVALPCLRQVNSAIHRDSDDAAELVIFLRRAVCNHKVRRYVFKDDDPIVRSLAKTRHVDSAPLVADLRF